jgi:error-prone DNA polymerase
MAGVVLLRQRPGKGNAIFITLEDETGVTNVLLWARIFERYRRAVMSARLLVVEGRVQKSPEGVVHLMGERAHDRTAELKRLLPDYKIAPIPPTGDDLTAPRHSPASRHPRDVRILPKSRDFH